MGSCTYLVIAVVVMMAAEFDCGDSIKADIFCAVVMLGHKLVGTVQIVESGSLSIGGAGCVFCHAS